MSDTTDRSQESAERPELSDKTILITGGAGFIGSNLANYLAGANDVLVVDDCYLGTPENLVDEAEAGSTILFNEAGGSPTDDAAASALRRADENVREERSRRAVSEEYNANRLRTSLINGTGDSDLGDSLSSTAPSDDPLALTRTVSNRELEKKLHAYGRRLKRVEKKLDDVHGAVEAIGQEQRPVGEVLQDILDDELSQVEAAAELGWSQSKVSKVVRQIQTDE